MQTGKGSFGLRIGAAALSVVAVISLSACQQRFSDTGEKNVIANVYGNRSHGVIGDVYSRSSDVQISPSYSGRW
ncbi:hypothetical protein [Cohnella sp. AR92]|uniref:hypothetical protein n=1 Tax=Cohnella sp. AR92 TaxID=648716 RepID=UPI000F8ECBBE|nr:hypothetical protein [Cohnella sp. AR92]RUS48371.1 hypothetical protein ELR57_02820 [Cohnella sp. AR92]